MSLRAYVIVYLVFLYLPVVLLPMFAFNSSSIIAFPLDGFSTRWFVELTRVGALHDATYNSLRIAIWTSLISTFFGVLVARANSRYSYRGKGGLTGLIMAPLVMPEIIIGVALLVVIVQVLGLPLSNWSVIGAHVLICTPFSAAIMNASFGNLDRSLEEAAIDLGCRRFEMFRLIVVPLVMPGIISSLLLTFTISLDEFMIAFFLAGAEPTLPVYIWGLIRFPEKIPVVMALGTILVCVSLVLLILAEVFRRRGLARADIQRTDPLS